MSILSIILSLESGCHNSPPLEDRYPRRSTPSREHPLLAMSVRPVLAYAYRTSSWQHMYHTLSLPEDSRVMRTYPYPWPVRHCILLNPRVLCRWASEKEGIPWWYEYSINPIKPWVRMSQSTTLRRPTSSSINPKPGTSPLSHARTSSSGIRVPYVQLAAYVPYRVPSQRTYASYVRTHIPDSYVTVSFSTDSYAPVKP
jgi:hypothetical protein